MMRRRQEEDKEEMDLVWEDATSRVQTTEEASIMRERKMASMELGGSVMRSM